MDALELCKAFLASLDKTPGSKPLRTYVDDDGEFTIEEDASDDTVERSTGYVGQDGRREPADVTRLRQILLGVVGREAWVED